MQHFQFNWLDFPGRQRVLAAALQFQFSQTQTFKADELRDLQFSLLQTLIEHCRAHVPYYRERGYAGIASWDDWARLPILSRSDVQEHSAALHAGNDLREREGRAFKKRSSGSTGRPIEVSITDRSNVYWKANTVRDHLWQQRDFSQTLAVIKQSGEDQTRPPGRKYGTWGESTGLLFTTGPSVVISSTTDISSQYAWLRQLRPGYLLTYPSVLRELALLNLAAPDPLRFLDITTMGETLSPETREFARRSFGAKVCDIYSCQEIGYVALQCPTHEHYHAMAETCLVEILDEQNQPCAPGEMGRVVVTHLHNHMMPLLRYDIGDYAVAGADCDCGITLPVLQRIIGRTRNLITLPDGTRHWPIYNMMKLVQMLPNAQFQLIQKSTVEDLLLRIGTDKPVADDLLQAMKAVINERLGHPFNMQFEVLPRIPRSRSGKFEDFVSEVKA